MGKASVPDMPRYQRARSAPAPAALDALQTLLAGARRPFLLVGGSGWTAAELRDLVTFAERFDLPVGVAWRRLECFDNHHANYAGHVGWGMDDALRARIRDADLLIAVGTRMGEATTEGYTLVQSPLPRQTLVHVYPDAGELGRVFRAELPIAADVVSFAAAAAALRPAAEPAWRGLARAAHAGFLAHQQARPAPGPLNLDRAACVVRERLPRDACLTVGAGNYALFPHTYYRFQGPGTSLAPTVGSDGLRAAGRDLGQFGIPAAHRGVLRRRWLLPDEPAGAGRGDAVPARHRAAGLQQRHVGTIRAHQEREFPGRTIALEFDNPDFAALVRATGATARWCRATPSSARRWSARLPSRRSTACRR